ncbi:hypothetical protein SELMODRAFT_446983 [Selaginella moellendorffii]|uniref:Uncharacterized protein n=1 Tax=Selaginella moellendorffii TaxID=88036 RepID=D8SVU1_SELML|nr:uncharacterized protein C16C10.8 [Selaginella moellendorffii]EFJ11559.1 hypothetical protein SELMODRAFT_446983 [Selaginella moellendorffii]|eukprot:XP_002987472.1 uncharacterized protein C16C10.8 [Selaginella moellendorffii]
MVWFQCDDCDDNLKKPSLPNHFRRCRASGFSCIDCGAKFDRQSVQQHTQCVSEVEKYGPKGVAAAAKKNGKNRDGGAVAEEIVNMGLSTRPPWSCSLCHIKATGREVLLVHGQSKRHGSKARAAIAARNPPAAQAVIEQESKDPEEERPIQQELSKDPAEMPARKKREREGKENENSSRENGAIKQEPKEPVKEEGKISMDFSKVVRWRKLISREIKKSSDGSVKRRKLEKAVIPAAIDVVKAAGMEADATVLKPLLENYLASTKKFSLHGKSVRKVAKHE